MNVGDLVIYNLGGFKDLEESKDIAIVVSERAIKKSLGVRSFRMFYLYHNEYINGWEDEYRVYSEGR